MTEATERAHVCSKYGSSASAYRFGEDAVLIRTHTPPFSRLVLSPLNPTASDSVHEYRL